MPLGEKLKLKTFVPLSVEQLERAWDDAQEVVEEGVELSPDCAYSVATLTPALVQEAYLTRGLRADLVQAAEKIASLQRQLDAMEKFAQRAVLWKAPTFVVEPGARIVQREGVIVIEPDPTPVPVARPPEDLCHPV